jgi:hypothetical protein
VASSVQSRQRHADRRLPRNVEDSPSTVFNVRNVQLAMAAAAYCSGLHGDNKPEGDAETHVLASARQTTAEVKTSINTSMFVREKSDRTKLQLHHGPVEIERKFLVAKDDWKQSAVRSVRIRDGLTSGLAALGPMRRPEARSAIW